MLSNIGVSKCIPRILFPKDAYIDHLICPIGYGIYRDPVCLPCEHTFCRQCIVGYFEGKDEGACPLCFETCKQSDFHKEVELVELVDQTVINCPLCDWSGQYQNYERHCKESCKNALMPCKYDCGTIISKALMEKHYETCPNKEGNCKYCGIALVGLALTRHEDACSQKELPCSICNETIKFYEFGIHMKLKHKSIKFCSYSYAGCHFFSEDDAEIKKHYRTEADKHMDMLCNTIETLEVKMKKVEKEGIKKPPPIAPAKPQAKIYPVKWSTGDRRIRGTRDNGWSVFLSDLPIYGNFLAKINILSLGPDQNTWKVCLGLFNTQQFAPGAWDRFRNSWGYVLGNGNKIHQSPAIPYGPPYDVGDQIWIEHKNRTITFYKNGKNLGIAFSNILGPFYLAASLSNTKHQIEIIEVSELLS